MSSGCALQCFRRYHVRSPSHVLSTTLKPYSTLSHKVVLPLLRSPTESPCPNHMPPLYRRHPRIRALAQDDPRIRAVAQDYIYNEQTKLALLPLSLDYENPDYSGNCCRRQSACVIGRRLSSGAWGDTGPRLTYVTVHTVRIQLTSHATESTTTKGQLNRVETTAA